LFFIDYKYIISKIFKKIKRESSRSFAKQIWQDYFLFSFDIIVHEYLLESSNLLKKIVANSASFDDCGKILRFFYNYIIIFYELQRGMLLFCCA